MQQDINVPLPVIPRGFAIASITIGVASLALCWVPFVGIAGGVAALILALIALLKKQSNRLSFGGITVGALAFVLGIALTASSSSSDSKEADPKPTVTAPATPIATPAEASQPTPEATEEARNLDDAIDEYDEGVEEYSEGLDEYIDEQDALEQRICDTYQVCSSPGEPKPTYTAEYCANIRYFFKVGIPEKRKKATALGKYDDATAKYWRLGAEAMSNPNGDPVPQDIIKVLTSLYLDGYHSCNFED